MTRDLTVEQYMEGPALIHPYRRHHSDKLEHCPDATSNHLPHLCTVSDCFLILLNVSSPNIMDLFPHQETISQA